MLTTGKIKKGVEVIKSEKTTDSGLSDLTILQLFGDHNKFST